MNKIRKGELMSIVSELETLRDRLGTVRYDESEAYDNMPEGLQCSERGEQMSENVDNLDEAYDSLDEVISNLQDVIDNN